MKYSDCPSVEVSEFIEAPPDVVWALVSDIQLPARFSSEFAGAEWLDDARGEGARFKGRNHHPAIGEWETISTVTACRDNKVFEWAVGDPEQPAAKWRFTLTAHGETTDLSQWMQMGPARSGINDAIDAMPEKESKILRRRLAEHEANMTATLGGIKQLAESAYRDRHV